MSQRAALMTGPGDPLEVRTLDDPSLEAGEAWIEIVASEVCGTDVHLHEGRLAGVPYPIIPGHVSVGRLIEARGVERDARGRALSPGDLLTFYDVVGTCHRCFYCTVASQPNLCPERRVYGITFPLSEGLRGGWATSMRLETGTTIVKLDNGLEASDVIGGGCGLFTGFGAVERAAPRLGDAVVVQGSGPVGLAAAWFARIGGCGPLIVIGDPAARLELAEAMGADAVFSVSDTAPGDRIEAVRDRTAGRGADVVIEASGNPAAVPEGFGLLRPGGRYVIAGHYTDAGPVAINPHADINRAHATVLGRWGTEERHVIRALELLARHRPPFRRVIGAEYGLERAGEALADVAGLRVTKAIIVPDAD
ncbi:MAG: zinc-binding dehydrogenase [Gemmatimonadota bacterium]|nr:zinc-binding dehydrogenase [Gemmatimonadota bacterium]